MQPITVTVGPLQTAAANNIAPSQTPGAGTLTLTGTPAGGSNAKSSQVTAAIAGNVLTVSATASGAMGPGQLLAGAGVSANTVVQNYGPTAGTYIVTPAQTVSSTTIYGNQVVTLDIARAVLVTTTADETARTLTIVGTDATGAPITETITLPLNTTKATALSFLTVTQAYISGNAAGALTLGTTTVADSPWVRLDPWSNTYISIQCTASGTVNYTVQQTLDNPNALINPVLPSAVTWVNSSDTAAVGATGTIQTNYGFVPVFARILLNSGSGSVTATFVQGGVVNR